MPARSCDVDPECDPITPPVECDALSINFEDQQAAALNLVCRRPAPSAVSPRVEPRAAIGDSQTDKLSSNAHAEADPAVRAFAVAVKDCVIQAFTGQDFDGKLHVGEVVTREQGPDPAAQGVDGSER